MFNAQPFVQPLKQYASQKLQGLQFPSGFRHLSDYPGY